MAAASWVMRSRRRAHLGGRSAEGTTQAMLARRQLEHGDCLSQRTLRLRHTTQLRGFLAETEAVAAETGVLASFSDAETEAPPGAGASGCGIADIGWVRS